MEHFKELLTVKDEDGIDKEGKLEQAKAFALDEIFTDNTNLSLNVQEDEILGTLSNYLSSYYQATIKLLSSYYQVIINNKCKHNI